MDQKPKPQVNQNICIDILGSLTNPEPPAMNQNIPQLPKQPQLLTSNSNDSSQKRGSNLAYLDM